MSVISMKQLLEAGVHFGHQTRRWNPKMAQYIFTERNGIYIIDLQKTVKKVEEAYRFTKEIAETGKPILFVGTKKQAQEGVFNVLPKKEVIKLRAEKEKLEKYLNGIKDMPELPAAIFVVDPRKENIAIQEAHRLGIPVIGIVDTNCDPEQLDFAIPGNDDAIRAVKLITGAMATAIIEGRQAIADDQEEVTEDQE